MNLLVWFIIAAVLSINMYAYVRSAAMLRAVLVASIAVLVVSAARLVLNGFDTFADALRAGDTFGAVIHHLSLLSVLLSGALLTLRRWDRGANSEGHVK